METVFPFGFPVPTAAYLTLYVLTFVLHQFCMHYVLAGTLYLSWCSILPGKETPYGEQRLARLIGDWLPFLLSAAITAGVAPLLFVQIVYPKHFYTANLLLSWKWMLVVPVLIVAFYLLYLLKSRFIARWPIRLRSFVTLGTAACFVFVGFCWTANHLLGNDESRWPEIYQSNELGLNVAHVVTRMCIWLGVSFTSLPVMAAWQLRNDSDCSGTDVQRMRWMALGGILTACVSTVVYLVLMEPGQRTALLGWLGLPYLSLTLVGAIVQAVGWWLTARAGGVNLRELVLVSSGLFLSLLSAAVSREVLRLHQLQIGSLYEHHAEAAGIGGLGVFLVFTVINGALIAACIWLVRSSQREEANR